MPSRTTRILRRRVGQMVLRIEQLEQPVGELNARRRPRFERPDAESDDGARVVAWHMLRTGTPAENVAAHLEDTFDLPDADSVVEDVAHYDSRPSEPNQEGR